MAIRRYLKKILDKVLPEESIEKSKEKWNSFAKKDAKFYVLTEEDKQDEETFKKTGAEDCRLYLETDTLIKETIGPLSNAVVLEIGCGVGRITEAISAVAKEVLAIDISEEMIEQAKKRLASKENVTLFATDGLTYPIEDNSVDVVFSFIVFQHMSSVDVVLNNLKEVGRVLKPGGIAKIQVRGIPVSRSEWFYGPSFTEEKIKTLLAKTPLKLKKSEGEGEKYFWLWLTK